MKYSIKKIAGVETIFAPMQDSNSITIQIFVRAGSVYETEKTNGISHFLEHMFFKGGKIYKTPKEVAIAVDSFGGTFNAYTGDEYASYYVKCSPNFVDKAIDVLGDMMVDAKFNKEEIEREKGVILQEIMMKQDNPARLVYEKRKLYYNGDNSYGRSTLGLVENIKSFVQKDFFTHKESLYTKDNLIIVVAGKIVDEDKIIGLLKEAFSYLPEKKKINKPKFLGYKPEKQRDSFVKKTEQNHLIIASSGFSGTDNRKYKANVLSVMLGGNMSSRLFQNIREKQGLCYYISSAHYTGVENGDFFIRAGIDKKRFDFGLEKILDEIDNFAKQGPNQKEFDNAIGYLQGQIQMGIESSDEMAEFVGSQYLMYNNIVTLQETIDIYKNMQMSDVLPYLDMLEKKNMFVYWIE